MLSHSGKNSGFIEAFFGIVSFSVGVLIIFSLMPAFFIWIQGASSHLSHSAQQVFPPIESASERSNTNNLPQDSKKKTDPGVEAAKGEPPKTDSEKVAENEGDQSLPNPTETPGGSGQRAGSPQGSARFLFDASPPEGSSGLASVRASDNLLCSDPAAPGAKTIRVFIDQTERASAYGESNFNQLARILFTSLNKSAVAMQPGDRFKIHSIRSGGDKLAGSFCKPLGSEDDNFERIHFQALISEVGQWLSQDSGRWGGQSSPLVEELRDLLTEVNADWMDKPSELLILSDLLRHQDEGVSNLTETDALTKPSTVERDIERTAVLPLEGVPVRVTYLPSPTRPERQTLYHQRFWRLFLEKSGATEVEWTNVDFRDEP